MSEQDSSLSCPVCYEEYSERDIELGAEELDTNGRFTTNKQRITLQSCQHSLCHDCWVEYCTHSISERAVPITCPIKGCEDAVPHQLVKFLLLGAAPENKALTLTESNFGVWEKFERLERLAADPSLVECTKCEELNSATLAPDVFCSKCSHFFCKVHGDSHSGMSCGAYERTKDARRIKKSEKVLDQWTKPCSRCGARIQKWKGCSIVECSSCKGVMCYKCGSHEHVQNHRCSNCESAVQARLWNCMQSAPCLSLTAILLLGVPLYFLFAAVWVVTTLLFSFTQGFFFGCCYKCGKDLEPEGKWSPLRGAAAVAAFICLPLLTYPDAIVEERRGRGFLDDVLHPSVLDQVREIPLHAGIEEDEVHHDEGVVEIADVEPVEAP